MPEITLTYVCGCRWSSHVEIMPAEYEQHTTTSESCLPVDCQSCTTAHPCAVRAKMPPAYTSVDFTDVPPVRRRKKVLHA